MPATYTLANAITEICAMQKDYEGRAFGANDPNNYDRAKKQFWKAVNRLIEPSETLQKEFPEFYNFAISITNQHIHGLIDTEDIAITSGEIDVQSAIDDLLKIDRYFNVPGSAGNEKYIKKVSMEKLADMASKRIYPENTLYVAEEGSKLIFVPTDEVDKIRIQYVMNPNNNMETSNSLLDTFNMTFILKAVELASLMLEYERMRA